MIYTKNGNVFSSVTSACTIEWISGETYYCGIGDFKRIKEGINGQEASNLIYNNDTLLRLKVESLEGQIEEYKEYVEKLKAAKKAKLSLIQGKGDSQHSIMTQASVTEEVNTVQKQIDDSVFAIIRVPKADVTLDVQEANYEPSTDKVDKAAQDFNGHVLSSIWYDIDDLKAITSALTATANAMITWKKEKFGG